jgi:nucleoside-diphosphate-sugar epimerase
VDLSGNQDICGEVDFGLVSNATLNTSLVNPPFIYGPFAVGFPTPTSDRLGVNRLLNLLLNGTLPPPLPPFFCDVRDVAVAHVAALDIGPTRLKKRFLVCGGSFTWKDAIEHLSNARPDIKARLPSPDATPSPKGMLSTIDVSRASSILKLDNYISWEHTVYDTVDALLKAEETWNSRL